MAKTKQRTPESQNVSDSQTQGKAVADDKTAIDDIESKKRKKTKEKLPKGYTKRLEAGVKRQIRVVQEELKNEGAKVFRVFEETENGALVGKDYDKVKIEGESELVHEVQNVCGERHGSAHIETTASILVGKSKR